MLNEILSSLSSSLLSAREIPPIAPLDGHISRWAERTRQAELRAALPTAVPGDGASLESLRDACLSRLIALLSGEIASEQISQAAQIIHTLLCAASWSDVSGRDPYAFDPDVIDEAFAETACTLAVAFNLLRDPLEAISPALTDRIEAELRRRMLLPLSEQMPLSHLSLQGCCLLLCAVILGGVGESLRWPAVRLLCNHIDQRLNRLPADGSMPGGIALATDTAILLMDAAEVIRCASRSRVNLTGHERIACMADYPLFAHLQCGWFVNPGDRDMQPALDAESLFRFGQRTSDSTLCDLSAWLLRNDRACASRQLVSRLLNRHTLRPLMDNPGRIRLFRHGMLPDAGLMFMRGFRLHMSMTAATNTSHGDAGNICLFHQEQPILVDLPDAPATSMHSLPTIGGLAQSAPVSSRQTEFGASDEDALCYSINLTAAYPAQCHITDYQRTLLMGSNALPGIRLMEMISLSQPEPADFHFICACPPTVGPKGVKIGPVSLQWNGSLTATVEPIAKTGCHRLTLHAAPSAEHGYIFEFGAK